MLNHPNHPTSGIAGPPQPSSPESSRDLGSGESWTPTVSPGESLDDLSLENWVGQALGTASSCWSNLTRAGTFDDQRCSAVFDGLMAHLKKVIDGKTGAERGTEDFGAVSRRVMGI